MNLPVWVVLAATPDPKQPFKPSDVYPGWPALLLLIGMVGAVVLLWFSMRKHLGRIDVGKHQRDHTPPVPRDGGGPT